MCVGLVMRSLVIACYGSVVEEAYNFDYKYFVIQMLFYRRLLKSVLGYVDTILSGVEDDGVLWSSTEKYFCSQFTTNVLRTKE